MIWLAVQAAALLAMAWVPGAASTPLPLLGLWAVAFAAYAAAAMSAESLSARTVWVGGIAMRLGLLGAAPALSEDIYRYVWDGLVSLSGTNPYAFAPAAEPLASIRPEWWEIINHPAVPTIYPPGAQIVFLALAAVAPGWLLFKLVWVAADLLVAGMVARLSRGGSRLPLLLYLWSPLLLVEVAWSGHFEPVGIAAMMGAVLLARGRGLGAGALLGLGASIKFAPVAAVPALLRRYGIGAAALAVAIPAVLYLPYAGVGARVFDGLRTYADIWQFNGGLFRILRWILDPLPGGGADPARLVGVLAVAGAALFAAWRKMDLHQALFLTIGTGLVVSPTIHPWYVLWVLPFACLSANRAWLLFTGTVFLAYAGRDAYLSTGSWPEPLWLRVLIHAPLLALLPGDRRDGRGATDPGA